jgi:hypothetical protein
MAGLVPAMLFMTTSGVQTLKESERRSGTKSGILFPIECGA